MKYDNYPAAKSLYDQITKKIDLLDALKGTHAIHVIIEDHTFGRKLSTISIQSKEHDLAELAKDFIEKVRAHTTSEIQTLTEQLEKL